MASSYPGSVSAAQVGSYFVGQYYQVLRQQPDLVHQFYSDSSSMIRVDGDYSETASDVLHIHNIVTSLNFSTIEIKTINSLDSWDGGVIVMVTGVVKIKDVNRKQKFVQTFFLAPQEKGYFVLNDIFQFVHEEVVHPNLVPVTSEKIDSQPHVSASFAEPPDYGFEEEAREYSVAQTTRRFLQLETDFEMALDPSRVLYDMDSEDEQWFSNIRNSEMYNGDLNGITEEMFEKTMDLLEKAAFAKLRDQFTPNEIEELMLNVGPLCIVKIIYDHWHQRRQKKGMALIRHFQPPMWERYQQQLKEWEVAVTKNNLSSNGCQDKGATLEKPPMFAFCLKPRGLELQNKGLKHRSQKKISVSGHTNNFRYHDGFHTTGRRPNGLAFSDERFVYPGHSYDSLDDSPLPLTSPRVFSPQDVASMKYYSMSNDTYYKNHMQKPHKSKSKKLGSFIYNNDSRMPTSYGQGMPVSEKRNGVRSNLVNYDIAGHRQYIADGTHKHRIEQLNGPAQAEYRRREAENAALHARKTAKFKRHKAEKLLSRADVATHRAMVALMTAEAKKASDEAVGDGR